MTRMTPRPVTWKGVGEVLPAAALQQPGHAPRTTADGVAADGGASERPSKTEAFNFGRHRWLGHVVRDKKLTGATVRVAVLLWELQNAERGCAWPALTTIARELRMHKSTAIRSLDMLERRGWITIKTRGGRYRSNEYRLGFGSMDDGQQAHC
jgi:Helix-turn-helix domain